jgi:hypothetical protein
MNEPEIIEPFSPVNRPLSPPWRWRFSGYSFVAVSAAVLLAPTSLPAIGLRLWDDSGLLLVPFATISVYVVHCAILIVTRRFDETQAQRLVIAGHLAYSCGVPRRWDTSGRG